MFKSHRELIEDVISRIKESFKKELNYKFSLTYKTQINTKTKLDFPAITLTDRFEKNYQLSSCGDYGSADGSLIFQILSKLDKPFEGGEISQKIVHLLINSEDLAKHIISYSIDNTLYSSIGGTLEDSYYQTNLIINFNQILEM